MPREFADSQIRRLTNSPTRKIAKGRVAKAGKVLREFADSQIRRPADFPTRDFADVQILRSGPNLNWKFADLKFSELELTLANLA